MKMLTAQVYQYPKSQSNTFLFDFSKGEGLIMKNQIKNKILVFPWDIKGYVELSNKAKTRIVNFLINNHRFKSDITKKLNAPDYWFYNFIRNQKIDTHTFKKIVDMINDKTLLNEIIQFNDDKGSSSIPFTGNFPIEYTPSWHFIFCLSVGDGYIRKGNKKKFVWYQKPEGQKKIIELLNKINFNYSPKIKNAKHGITIPQLIRKVGSFATKLDSSQSIKSNLIEVSKKLGKDYEVALLCAFFIDEAGMGKSKSNSEITLHQEGNLPLLEKIGDLLNRFDVKWSKNKKGDKWCIRINSEGVVKLPELFYSLKKHNINLLHREEIFQKKVKMAKETLYKIPLKEESVSIREYLLNNYRNKIISLDEIRRHYKSNFNVSLRSRQLVHFMKKKKELQTIDLGKYIIKGK
ncbi:hypothetical protein KY347_02620 [Candidatus Woesearchaeota archaeon]|nr:hypothetical protein [Candidatus Woesearchaeota archaeon]